jgi:hypothetical protein
MDLNFRISKGWRVFAYISLPIFGLLFIYLGLISFIEPSSTTSKIVFPIISLGGLILLYFGFLDIHRTKITITKDRILKTGATKTKELLLIDAKGYIVENKRTVIVPEHSVDNKIKISEYIERRGELDIWLEENLVNLDAKQIEEEEQQILTDEGLGGSTDERLLKLEKARKVCRILNGGAVILTLWTFIKPEPYDLVISLAMLYPLAVLVVLYLFKGFIRLDEKQNTAYPNLSTALVLPALALALRALLDFNLLSYKAIWVPIVIATAGLSFVFITVMKKFLQNDESRMSKIFYIICFKAVYSYGAVIVSNCYYDNSTITVFTSEVLDKHKSTGKHTSYYLTLRAWGPINEDDDTDVDPQFYDVVEKGDIVSVYFQKGRLGIPWYYVGK